MTRYTLGYVAVAAMLSSCASTGLTTIKSEPNESARVRFVAGDNIVGTTFSAAPYISVRMFDDVSCSEEKTVAKLTNGPFAGAKQLSLSMPLNTFHKNASAEMYLPGDRDTTFLIEIAYVSGTTSYKCGVLTTVRFRTGSDYELATRQFVPASKQCFVDFYEILPQGPSERLLLDTFDNSVTNSSDDCDHAFRKMRWY